MNTAPCTVLVSRRRPTDGGDAWSIHLVNGLSRSVVAVIEQVAFEWGDMGHSKSPMTQLRLPPGAVHEICQVDGDDAEMSMSLVVRITSETQSFRVSFELSRLYRYRNPTFITALGRMGWQREADGWSLS